jgi:molecular chaperone HscA
MLLQIHEPGETPDPHARERGIAIGIDLGTTNSVVAVVDGEQPEVLRDPEGDGLIPSVVALMEDRVVVGRAAQQVRVLMFIERFAHDVERRLDALEQ